MSIHKLARIVSIATPENEEELVEKTKMLSQSALEVLVRDEKYAGEYEQPVFEEGFSKNQNGLFELKNRPKSLRTQTDSQQFSQDVKLPEKLKLLEHLSPELQKNLLQRAEKGINITKLLTELLQKHDLELAEEKEQLAREQQAKRSTAVQKKKKPSRYIPAKIRHHLTKQYGTKCAIKACCKTSDHIHHTARWSLSQNHDPNYLAPLCKPHHELAHAIDTRVQQKRNMVQRC